MARLRPFTLAVAVAFVLVLAGTTATADAAAARASRAADEALPTTQLPRGIRPTHYEVAVTPDAAALTFDGRVAISIEVLEPTRPHHAERHRPRLRDRVRLCGPGRRAARAGRDRRSTPPRRPRPSPSPGRSPPGTLSPRDRLRAARSAPRPSGCSPSTTTRRPAASARSSRSSRTPTRAASSRPGTSRPTRRPSSSRRPCRPAQMAVSNMPVAATTPTSATAGARVRFATSPKMSTYLLFFAVGDFERATDARRRRPRSASSRSAAPSTRRGSRSTAAQARPARVQRLLRHALSAAQARQRRRARRAASSSARWRTGARSSPSSALLVDPADLDRGATASASSRSRRTRSRTSGSATS